ncbi:MAG: sorbosone dehydrogenase family protein [Flavipsychrobacter sp.]|nr:sorbosone dehydrogenase family protein [Flavipsychrobacter sp.]
MKKILFSAAIALLASHYTTAQNTRTDLPAPNATKSVMNFSKSEGWKDGNKPQAPAGLAVTKYAEGFQNPRWMYVLPNGDVLVAESNMNMNLLTKAGAAVTGADNSHDTKKSADRITLLRDADKDGIPETRNYFIVNGLNQPFGMLYMNGYIYVANTDAVVRFPYKEGQTSIADAPQKITDLRVSSKNQHWTRNIIANADNSKIYIAVGSSSNVAENGLEEEIERACIIEMNPDGSKKRIYAEGLRNPVGMDWAPGTQTLWTTVNERDGLGDDLVPDYLTSVKDGGFYGWPYSYWGQNIDTRVKDLKPELLKKTIVPEVDLGSHTASLGLAFYRGKSFPARYHGGAFIAQHGSWNRSTLSGYKVVFVPFKNRKPSGKPEDFLTGFIADLEKDEVYGRPTGIVFLPDGSMLLTDDVENTIWRVAATK